MEIVNENNRLKLIWSMPIQTLTTTKNNKYYHSFKVSFPLDLKNYIENNIGSLDIIKFYEIPSCIGGLSAVNGDAAGTCEATFIDIGGKLPDGAELVATPKLVSFKKESHLFVTLPKKVSIFKSISVDVKAVLKLVLCYDSGVCDYVLRVFVVNVD